MSAARIQLRRKHRRAERRGIVLLVIISILVLFMLMLVTFAVVTGHYRDAARATNSRKLVESETNDSHEVLDDIMYMLLGEPSSQRSSLWSHSLLADLYGESVGGTLSANAVAEGGGSFCSFNATRSPVQAVNEAQFSNVEGYYVGCVLTMTDGPCAGLSTRVTHYVPLNVDTPNVLAADNIASTFGAGAVSVRVEGFEGGLAPLATNHFILNGKPFSGTGHGRQFSGAFSNDQTDGNGFPWALMPHLARWSDRTSALRALYGGVNEPWDTYDFQNMFLTLVQTDTAPVPGTIFPAFHRPDLISYWEARLQSQGTPQTMLDPTQGVNYRADVARQVMFRPLASDHTTAFANVNPAFNPASPAYNPAGGPWDVDNDGDGIPDSIWIDPGLPVVTAPDGRQYKRLVAFMVRDQESRVNLNAAGHPDWAKALARPETQVSGNYAGNDSGTAISMPRGLGYGPAEVNFTNMFKYDYDSDGDIDTNDDNVALALYQQLFQGTLAGNAQPGKYGVDTPTALGPNLNTLNRRPGIWGPNGNGAVSNDPLSVIKTQGHGIDYTSAVFSNNATPPDVWGRGALALDYTGQPVHLGMGAGTDWQGDGTQPTVEINDNPYEINLVDPSSYVDTPYTVAELERVLRYRDVDVNNLPQRLAAFLGPGYGPFGTPGSVSFQRRAETLTTLGMSMNVPSGAIPSYMRVNVSNPNPYWLQPPGSPVQYVPPGDSILDVARARIQYEINQGGTNPTESMKQYVLKQVMPFEFFQGRKFDLNRPFGNGVDDNAPGDPGYGVVDEPGETDNTNASAQEQAWTNGPFAGTAIAMPLNDAKLNWWSPPSQAPYNQATYLNYLDTDPHLYARQLYARNVYCLLMLLCDPNYPGTFSGAEALNAAQQRRLWCRRLAQYAVNLVDFRDPDAIMTPFEYDEYPFDGWHVDGNLLTNENDKFADGSTNSNGWLPNYQRQVVWGMEQPDLLLTETKSFHDKRIRDTKNDTSGKNRDSMPTKDEDLDQLRLPQGSTFIELYCTRNRLMNNAKLPGELYNLATGRLDLMRMTAASSYDGAAHPVWQIAISRDMNPPSGGTLPSRRPNQMAVSRPDSFSLEPTLDPTASTPSIIASAIDATLTIPIQRYVWFPSVEPAAGTNQTDNTFINSAGWDVSLDPGQYLIVGPRTNTVVGSVDDGDTTTLWDGNSPQAIALAQNALTITNVAGTTTSLTPGTQIRAVKCMVADIHPPRNSVNTIDGAGSTWPTSGMGVRRVGLSVTEPLVQSGMYYTYPTNANDAYGDLNTPDGTTDTFPDVPFDYTSSSLVPINASQMFATATYADRHTVVLQRLANPLQPWHPQTNPYINVDWAGNDVTVFTGDENTNRQNMAMEDLDPNDPPAGMGGSRTLQFGTRQRGNTNVSGNPTGQLWGPRTAAPGNTSTVSGAGVYFSYNLTHTLGYVNGNYTGGSITGGIARPLANPPAVAGDPAVPAAYVGEPNVPFPWIMWNNRPLANPMELLAVPTSSPQGIGFDFAYTSAANVYNYSIPGGAVGNYHHLPNFFLSNQYQTSYDATTDSGTDLARFFDYVETPSPYVGTERWYNPAITNADTGAAGQADDVGLNYRAPFNKLPRFRDPGKVNINTVVDPLVWDALMATYPDIQTAIGATTFYQFLQTRRGYVRASGGDTNSTSDMYVTNPNYPTLFANPVRPADAFDLAPLASMKLRRPVDATVLRSYLPPLSGNGTTMSPLAPLPLLQNSLYDNPAGGATANSYRATDRNAYFRYQPYAKLSNMITTTSNTFAVWMTVGYFEVTPLASGPDAAHPDGYLLGAELVFDDGTVRRPRAFYLIDRSIPVAFEPGKRNNIDRCVLHRRYIE
jgi:hypothetical protein